MTRYDIAAAAYDWLSGESLLYRAGRVQAIELLAPRPGERVLLPGCGTGLDLPYLAQRVGPTGGIVGVDVSRPMLDRARRRTQRAGWNNVTLIHGNAADLGALGGQFDVVVFCYTLGVMGQWQQAWSAATSTLRPGGRVGIVDTDIPIGTRGRCLAKLATSAGGVDPERRVWDLITDHTDNPVTCDLAGGHVRIAVGTWRSQI